MLDLNMADIYIDIVEQLLEEEKNNSFQGFKH